MRLRKILCVLMAVIMLAASFSGTVFAAGDDSTSAADGADFEGTVYSLSSGISVKLPSDYTQNLIWDQMDDTAPGLAAWGYSSAEAGMKGLKNLNAEIITYRDGETRAAGYMFFIAEEDAPEDLSVENLFSCIFGWLKEYNPSSAPVYGYGTDEVNGVPVVKVYSESSVTGDHMYNYILVTDTGKLYLFTIWGDGKDYTDAYFDELARNVISSVTVSDELRSHVIAASGEPFRMIEGEHAGALWDNENNTSAENFGIDGDPNYEGTVCSTNAGISIKLPTDYTQLAIWDQMDDTAPGVAAWGLPSAADAISLMKQIGEVILMTDQGDDITSSRYALTVLEGDAPEDLSNESLYNHSADVWYRAFDSSTIPAYGCGTTEINGIPAFKMYVELEDGSICTYSYNYTLVTDTGKFYLIVFDDFSGNGADGYIDKLARDVISSLTLSDELRSHVVTLPGEPFRMMAGDHAGVYTKAEYAAAGITASSAPAADTSATTSAEKPKTLYQKITGFEFPMYLILLALVFILFFGSKLAGKGDWHEDPLSLETSKAIQGFCAVAIIIHHLAQELMEKAESLFFFEQLGVLFVGVFFFFSGYGLFTSLKTKDNYLKGFLKKRLVTILVPFYVCILIFVAFACINGETFEWQDALKTISGWFLINSHMWYIVEIAILYLAFFVIYRLIKNRAVATAVMTLFVAGLTAGSFLLGHGADMSCRYWFQGEWWYNTTFAFILGILVSQNADKLRSFARRSYAVLLPVFAALTVAFGFLTNYAIYTRSYWSETPDDPAYGDKLFCLAFQLPWVLFFVVTLVLIMMKVRFGNPVLKFLGSISLELYLIHNLFLQGLSMNGGSMAKIPSSSLYMLLTVLLSVGFAAIISGLDKYIIGLINGKSRNALPAHEAASGRIHSIDVMRIVMAFLVVTIHLPFNGRAGEIFVAFGKTAVPFFLTVCGYMLYREDSRQMMKRLVKQTVRIFLLYLGSNILYGLAAALRIYMMNGNLNGFAETYFTAGNIKDFLLYNMSPFSEHLWFLGSLFYALVILIVLNSFKAVKYAMWFAPLLIAAYVVLSHFDVAEYYVLRNAILVGLPYVMMGMLIRCYGDKLTKIKAPILWILAALLCAGAVFELNWWQKGTEIPFISCEILVYVIMLLCLKYPDFGRDTLAEKMGRDLSLPIYILHMLAVMFIPMKQGYMTTYGAITVFIITALVSALYAGIKHGFSALGGSLKRASSRKKELAE